MPTLTLHWDRVKLALSFLSRFAPAQSATRQEMIACVSYFPVVAVILGVASLLFTWLAQQFFQNIWVTAWLSIGFSLWYTRGLHWDGWADLWDAWGSNAQGEEFWRIMKDSRCGAFAVMGLFFGLTGMFFCTAMLVQKQEWACIFLAILLGRCLSLLFAATSKPYVGSSQGVLAAQGITVKKALLFLAPSCLMAFYFLPFMSFLFLIATVTVVFNMLHRLATKHGGFNGDFLGSSIIWGELLCLLAGTISI